MKKTPWAPKGRKGVTNKLTGGTDFIVMTVVLPYDPQHFSTNIWNKSRNGYCQAYQSHEIGEICNTDQRS